MRARIISIAGEPRPRAGESGSAPARTSRLYRAHRAWYFHTREGAPIGPFNNRQEAVQGVQDFLEFIALAKPSTRSRLYAALTP